MEIVAVVWDKQGQKDQEEGHLNIEKALRISDTYVEYYSGIQPE